MTDLTSDERAIILRALRDHRSQTSGELALVEGIRAKLNLPPPAVAALSVDTLGLSVRAANCLANAGLATIGQVAATTDRERLRLRHLGTTTLREIRGAVAAIGAAR